MLVLDILRHTPPAVFALLAYLVWQGVQALRPRQQPLWRIVVAPLVFAASGLALIAFGAAPPTVLAAWILAVAAGLAPGLRTGPRVLALEPATGRLSLAGSPVPLLRNLAIFTLQYGIAVSAALHLAPPDPLAIARAAVSGASLGYCTGWLIALHRAHRTLRRREATASSPAVGR